LCREPPVNTYKPGFHPCQFGQCRQRYESGESFIGGNGEIYVPGREGVLYNAPVLISHYVDDHDYRPPDEFVEAVLALDGPNGLQWDVVRKACGVWSWEEFLAKPPDPPGTP
jgi:hypothetical protein